jgi:hypothetical protein
MRLVKFDAILKAAKKRRANVRKQAKKVPG